MVPFLCVFFLFPCGRITDDFSILKIQILIQTQRSSTEVKTFGGNKGGTLFWTAQNLCHHWSLLYGKEHEFKMTVYIVWHTSWWILSFEERPLDRFCLVDNLVCENETYSFTVSKFLPFDKLVWWMCSLMILFINSVEQQPGQGAPGGPGGP